MPLQAESKRRAAMRAKRVSTNTTHKPVIALHLMPVDNLSCVFCSSLLLAPHQGSPMAFMSISSHTAERGNYKRATSLRLAPYARLRGCGHYTCYPCAVAYGIAERLGSKSNAVCPCCLKESFVDKFKTAEQDNLLEGDDNAFSCSQASGSPLSPIYQQQPDAAIEQLRERYRALRETEAQRAAQRLRLASMAPPILSPPIGKSEDEPTSILRRSDFRTPSRCGVSRCASLIRTPSTEPMGVTPVPNTPPTIPSRARSISPSVSFKWGAGSFHLDQPITPASARTAKSSFLKGSRLCQAKPKSFQSAFDLIFRRRSFDRYSVNYGLTLKEISEQQNVSDKHGSQGLHILKKFL